MNIIIAATYYFVSKVRPLEVSHFPHALPNGL